MLLAHGTVIAVVDGATIHLFRNTAHDSAVALTAMDAPKLSHDGGASSGHHSSSANPEKGADGEDGFIRHVADYLNTQVLGHKIAHLVVIAPPRALGELRKHFHKATQAAIVHELAKELTGASMKDIATALNAGG
jgi:protein required for attachment to host cells